MKIFFDASLSGREEYERHYAKIIAVIESLSHVLIKSTLMLRKPQDVALETSKQAEDWYKQLKKWLSECDVAIFEVSYSSTGIGHEVTLALDAGKPVIALYVKGKHPFVLETIPSDKIQVIDYALDDLAPKITKALEYAAGQVDTRFNFFISPHISNYLDWVAKKKRTPRAVYLRKLIEKAMIEEKFEE
ncbi:hypothetical protein A3B57_02100 [Microgenomates group bacterium RIFCSPLOWO2_01_FULL_47_10]|nr:MAG: hypothetical protein A3B57_02100 [Microgenomates group bacterium RIFCSPLOWO2_01_FULL_47_10]